MSVQTVRNVMQVMIGKSVAATGASVQLTSPTGANYIADGEIVALGTDRKYLTPGSTITDHEFIYLVYRSGSTLHYTNKITGRGLKKVSAVDGSQGNEQIYHVGYVGSGTQNVDVTEGNDFYLHITNTYNDMQWSEQQDRRPYFSTFAVPTSEKVTADLTKQICIDPGSAVRAEMLNSGSAAVIGAGITVTTVNEGRTVSFSGAHGLVAGDYVRIGTTTAASGIGTGIPIYKVASVPSSTTITLEWPYQGPSQTNLDGNADCGKVTLGSLYGIRLTGEALDYRMDFIRFMRTTFKVHLTGLGSTVLTKTQEMSLGRGDGRQVAEFESFAQGFDGPMNRLTVPLPLFRTDADKSTTVAQNATYGNSFTSAATVYDGLAIIHGQAAPHFATAPVPAQEEVRLFIVDGAAQTANLLAQLNPWVESAGLTAVSV